jgi:hypothetical protein
MTSSNQCLILEENASAHFLARGWKGAFAVAGVDMLSPLQSLILGDGVEIGTKGIGSPVAEYGALRRC